MTSLAAPLPRAGAALRALPWPLAAFLLTSLAAALPILAHGHLPLVDLPNHIARLHIAATGGEGALGEYYEYTLSLVPNSAADLIWHALGHPGDAARFAQVLMAIYAVNFIAAAMVLGRVVHGRWTAWPAVAALLVYNGPFFYGFQNFVFSLPFALYGLALWLALERRGLAARLAVFAAYGLALYLMHLFAFAILAIAAFGREAQVALERRGPLAPRAGRLCLLMLPFALPVLWLAYSILTGPPNPVPGTTFYSGARAAFQGLISPVMNSAVDGLPVMRALGYGGLALLAVCALSFPFRSGPRLSLDRRLWGPAAALLLAAILAPFSLHGVAWVQIRVPVMVVAVLVAGSAWRGLSARQVVVLTLAFASIIAARGLQFERYAAEHGAEMRDMAAVTETVPPGARVLSLRGVGMWTDERRYHVDAHLVGWREAFVPTLFQGTHALSLKPEWRDSAHYQLQPLDMRFAVDKDLASITPTFVQDWEEKFTHVLLLDPGTGDLARHPHLEPVAERGRFKLFRVIP